MATSEIESEQNASKTPLLHAFLAGLLPAILASFKILNRDIGYHVATGRAVDLTGVPTTNVLSFTNPDFPWILHQWAPAWLFHKIDQWAGPVGLVAVKVAVIYATFVLLWLAIRRQTTSGAIALLWFTVAACAAAPRYYVRPFIFSMLFLSAFLWALTYRNTGTWRRFVLATTVVCAACSALHAGFVYILITAGCVLGAAIVTRTNSWKYVVWFLGLISACALTLEIVNPHGWRVLLLPFQFSTDPYYHEHLVEFRAPHFDVSNFPALWLGLLTAIAACVSAGIIRWRKQQFWDVQFLSGFVTFAFFTWLVLRHERTVFAWALITSFFAAQWTETVIHQIKEQRARTYRMLIATLAVILGAHSIGLWSRHATPGFGVDHNHYPNKILTFIDRQSLPDPAYVSDAWGGYWLWAFYPERRVFYDNRLEAYPFEFFINEYQSIRYGDEGWESKLAKYDIKLAVLRYSTKGERKFLKGRTGIRNLMLESPRWQLVYWDELGMVFVRRDTLPSDCRRCGNFSHFNPDLGIPTTDDPIAVAKELAEVLKLSGPSARLYRALTRTAIWKNDRPLAARWLKEGLKLYPEDFVLGQLAKAVINQN